MPTVTTYAQAFTLDTAFFGRLTNAELYSTNATSRTYQGTNGHDLVAVTGTGFGAFDNHGYPTTGVITGLEIWWEDEAHVVNITGMSLSASTFFGAMGNGAWTNFVTTLLAGNDTFNGGPANDSLYGGGAADTMTGGGGNDALHGDAGDDTFVAGPGNDTFDGGAGIDTVTYASAAVGMTADLNAGTAMTFEEGNADTLIAIESIVGSDFSDTLYGLGVWTGGALGSIDDRLYGGGGDDYIDGGLGADTLDGGAGSDTVAFVRAHGAVTASLSIIAAQDTGGAGVKTLANFENIVGSGADDALTGDGGANRLYGGAGADTLNGLGGADTLDGGDGNDVLDGGGGADFMTGGLGDDSFQVDNAGDTVVEAAGGGTDTVSVSGLSSYTLGADLENLTYTGSAAFSGVGNAANNTLTGGSGADSLAGLDGDDTLWGQAGNDTLHGGLGNDFVYGGAGDDDIWADAGSDRLSGDGGDDTLHAGQGGYLFGGDGNDTLLASGWLQGWDYRASIILYGGVGSNTLSSSYDSDFAGYNTGFSTPRAVTVDLAAGTAAGAGFTDTLIGIRNAWGSQLDDSLSGDANANTLIGDDGSDMLKGMEGNDLLLGQSGADTLYGGVGNDQLEGGYGVWADTLYGGGGRDTARFMDVASTGANWTHNSDGSWTVAAGVDGIDTLFGIERLQFTDRVVVIGQEAVSDFNGDGKSDVLWRNDNGELYVWNSQSGQGAFLGQTLGNVGNSWHVQAVGDYDADGKADVLWRNNTGDLYIYRSDDSAAVTFTGQSISYVDPVWQIVPHAGDFNGDGRADILYRNSNTGEAYLWRSYGGPNVNFNGQTLGVVGQSWHIQGVDDFDADGKADVLWRNDGGDVYVWLSRGIESAVTTQGQTISSVPNDWSIIGTGDFNGDGRADILWRHAGDGELYVWNSQTNSAAVNFVGQSLGIVGLDWTVAAIGDYDGDGRADVLFRNTDGRVYVWNSNDTGPVGFQGQGLGTTPTDWHIVSDFHGM